MYSTCSEQWDLSSQNYPRCTATLTFKEFADIETTDQLISCSVEWIKQAQWARCQSGQAQSLTSQQITDTSNLYEFDNPLSSSGYVYQNNEAIQPVTGTQFVELLNPNTGDNTNLVEGLNNNTEAVLFAGGVFTGTALLGAFFYAILKNI